MKKTFLRKTMALAIGLAMVVTTAFSGGMTAHAQEPVGENVEISTTTVSEHGQLSVNGTNIVDSNGNPFQLRGISTHGINWDVGYPYVNYESFKTLRDEWGVNAIRLAMYVREYNGYCQGGNKADLRQWVVNGVNSATDLGMYAVIDWHVLNENPLSYVNDAKDFFGTMSTIYKGQSNVIYEICNEPNNCSWEDIKNYANQVIPVIRANSPNAIIIVGTPFYSQLGTYGNNQVADSPLTGYSNILYSLHFYTNESGHNELKNKLDYAYNRGIPVIVSEFGLSAANGNNGINTSNADDWLNRCDSKNISYFCWSLSNKNESASLLSPSTKLTSHWPVSQISGAGQFIMTRYNNRKAVTDIPSDPAPSVAGSITVAYRTHIQDIGWQGWKVNGETSGTSGQSKRLEALLLKISNTNGTDLGITYQTHIQDIGWQDWKNDGALSGTSGQSKRLEAIRIKLTGSSSNNYDVYYRVHAEDFGWLGWAKNGEASGTSSQSKRLEAIEIKIVPKGSSAPGSTSYKYIELGKNSTVTSNTIGLVNYYTHVEDYGNQNYVYDGSISGTSGESKRLEGIWISLGNTGYSGNISYQTHIQDIGWQSVRYNGTMSGTSGQSKRLEGIKIKLEGEVSNHFDVYYRVHVQDIGWLGWAKNGEASGTEGMSKRLEGIQIVLIPKGETGPHDNGNLVFYK